jgi:hypothetical protein
MHEIIDKKFYLGPKFGTLINKKWITISELLHTPMDNGGVETSLSFLKASSLVLQRCWSNSGAWRWPWWLRSLLFGAPSSDSFGPVLRLCFWRWCSQCSPLGVFGGCPRWHCSLLHYVLGGTTLPPDSTTSFDPGRGTRAPVRRWSQWSSEPVDWLV